MPSHSIIAVNQKRAGIGRWGGVLRSGVKTTYLAGIGIGTTGAKAMIFDVAGTPLASAYNEYPCSYPRPNWVEQDANLLVDATMRSVREAVAKSGVAPRDIASISVSAKRCCGIFLDSPPVFHICGDHNKNLPLWKKVPMSRAGAPAILSIGHEVSLETAAEHFPEHIIAGNIEPRIVVHGTPEEVYEASRKCILVGKEHCRKGQFIFMAGCEVPYAAPCVNVYMMQKAVQDFGRYARSASAETWRG